MEFKSYKEMAYYIKVTMAVADHMGLASIRNKTADGNVILWQSDLAKYGTRGDNIFARAAYVGGVVLTASDAKKEIDGTDTPVQPETPEGFGGSTESTEDGEYGTSNMEDEV